MNLPDFCSIVSMPEWICPPPAPSFEDQVLQAVSDNGQMLATAGIASMVIIEPLLTKRHWRLLATGSLLTASIGTLAGSILSSSIENAAIPIGFAIGGLIVGTLQVYQR